MFAWTWVDLPLAIVPTLFTETVDGDRITFTESDWPTTLISYVMAGGVAVGFPLLVRWYWNKSRYDRRAVLCFTPIWLVCCVGLVVLVRRRNDHVTVTPAYLELVQSGDLRVVEYTNIRGLEWFINTRRTRSGTIYVYHSVIYLHDGSRLDYTGHAACAATQRAVEIMKAQGLIPPDT